MSERKVNIDELFRRQMGDHAETPPGEVWEQLEKRLDGTPPTGKKPFGVWWFWAISGLLLISATAIIAGYQKPDREVIADNHPNNNTPAITNVKDDHPTTAQTHKSESNKPAPLTNIQSPGKTNNSETIAANTEEHVLVQKAKVRNEESLPATQSRGIKSIETKQKQNIATNSVSLPQVVAGRQDELTPVAPRQTYEQVSDDNTADFATATSVQLPAVRTVDEVPQMSPSGIKNNIPVVAAVPVINDKVLPGIAVNSNDVVAAGNALQPNGEQLYGLPSDNLLAAGGTYNGPMTTGLDNEKYESKADPEPSARPNTSTSPDTAKKKRKKLLEDTTSILKDSEPLKVSRKKVPLPIEFGVKAGYAMGFNSEWRANKFAVAPYIEYRLPANLSVVLQPTYHTGNATVGDFTNGERSYYDVKSNSFDSSGRIARGVIDSTVVTANPPDTVYRTYTYTQQYDSVHVSYGVSQTNLWDIEIPLMLKYKLNNKFSVFAGGSVTYSSVLQTKEEVSRYSMVNEYVENIDPETFYVTVQGQQPPSGPARKSYDELFRHSGDPINDYTPRTVTESNNFFRYGFMIGGSYTFKERLMIELMLHKTGVDANAVPDKDLQRLYSQPYLRLMIGYKIFK